MESRLDHLFFRLQTKGFMSIEIPDLVKDVFDIMGDEEHCTLARIEEELEDLGWGIGIMDYEIYELITSLVEGNGS